MQLDVGVSDHSHSHMICRVGNHGFLKRIPYSPSKVISVFLFCILLSELHNDTNPLAFWYQQQQTNKAFRSYKFSVWTFRTGTLWRYCTSEAILMLNTINLPKQCTIINTFEHKPHLRQRSLQQGSLDLLMATWLHEGPVCWRQLLPHWYTERNTTTETTIGCFFIKSNVHLPVCFCLS